ncbi:hypothetical protein ACFOSD_07110 [Salinispirillum marinum]|uniref:Uncharacterized protein n=2 Tax=Saccharospirillaceae TaxID=255527 RepID=A0ABV8BFK9_9GAMM
MTQSSWLLAVSSIPLAVYAGYIVYLDIGSFYTNFSQFFDGDSPLVPTMITLLLALTPLSILGVGWFLYRRRTSLFIVPLLAHALFFVVSLYLTAYVAMVLIWFVVSKVLLFRRRPIAY